jgi:hypothetical protein
VLVEGPISGVPSRERIEKGVENFARSLILLLTLGSAAGHDIFDLESAGPERLELQREYLGAGPAAYEMHDAVLFEAQTGFEPCMRDFSV